MRDYWKHTLQSNKLPDCLHFIPQYPVQKSKPECLTGCGEQAKSAPLTLISIQINHREVCIKRGPFALQTQLQWWLIDKTQYAESIMSNISKKLTLNSLYKWKPQKSVGVKSFFTSLLWILIYLIQMTREIEVHEPMHFNNTEHVSEQ